MTGHEFADALDKAGLTITRATAGDVQALDALRHDDQIAASSGIEASGRHFATLEIGDFAAVTKSGDVFRLNAHKLDFAEIEQRLADVQPRMASVTEARAFNQLNPEQTAELWAERRAENTAHRVASSEARDADREIRAAAATVQHEKQGIIRTVEQAVDRGAHALGRFLGGFGSMLGQIAEAAVNTFAPPPPPTRDQAERMERVAEERQTQAAAAAESKAAWDEIDEQIRRDKAARELEMREGRTVLSRGGRERDKCRRLGPRAGTVTPRRHPARQGKPSRGTRLNLRAVLRNAARAIFGRQPSGTPPGRAWRRGKLTQFDAKQEAALARRFSAS